MAELPLAQTEPWSVTAVNERVRGLLAPLPLLRVQGEASRVSQSSGHYYFDLKDATSRLAVKLWRTTALRLRHLPREGQQFVVTGRLEAWVAGGSYALICSDLEPAGQGAMWMALQRLKEKLLAEGLFSPERKRALPYLPRTVALVTSPTGAAVADMLRVLRDRFPLRILVVPAKVQGEGAAESIAAGIELVDQLGWADLIIAGRGGGSAEDLFAFNEERVVRAVAACRTPIISAVGHEIDTVLSDFAADARAPTPTAAAEQAVPRLDDLAGWLQDWRIRATRAVARQLLADRRLLVQLRARLGEGGAITGMRTMLLDDLRQRLVRGTERVRDAQRRRLEGLVRRLQVAHPRRRLMEQRARLDRQAQRLLAQGLGQIERRRQLLALRSEVLAALSPRAALGRGYAIVRQVGGPAVAGVQALAPQDVVQVLMRDGQFTAQVREVDPIA